MVLREFASHLPVHQLTRGGCVRYCDSCELIKPDRCHHCSVCNRLVICNFGVTVWHIDFLRCVLKMDHHCPWLVSIISVALIIITTSDDRVNNCVGFSNYKFFVLFLFYSVLLCVWLCITGLNAFIMAWVIMWLLSDHRKSNLSPE